MDTNAIAQAIQAEITRLSQALAILTGGTKKRGRPRKDSMPDWVTSNKLPVTAPAPEKSARKKRNFSKAQRAAQAKRMKAYWAAKKKAAKKSA
jgi:hypothetical protein